METAVVVKYPTGTRMLRRPTADELFFPIFTDAYIEEVLLGTPQLNTQWRYWEPYRFNEGAGSHHDQPCWTMHDSADGAPHVPECFGLRRTQDIQAAMELLETLRVQTDRQLRRIYFDVCDTLSGCLFESDPNKLARRICKLVVHVADKNSWPHEYSPPTDT